MAQEARPDRPKVLVVSDARPTRAFVVKCLGAAFRAAVTRVVARAGRRVPSASTVAAMNRIRTFLGEHVGENLTLGELSAMATMSRSHFSHTFHAVLGMSLATTSGISASSGPICSCWPPGSRSPRSPPIPASTICLISTRHSGNAWACRPWSSDTATTGASTPRAWVSDRAEGDRVPLARGAFPGQPCRGPTNVTE